MALQKEIILPYGIAADYHKITAFAVNVLENTVNVNVALYKDVNVRLENMQPIQFYNFVFSVEAENIDNINRGTLYEMLRQIDFYKNSNDC